MAQFLSSLIIHLGFKSIGTEKAHNFFQPKFFGTHPTYVGPQKKLCASFPGKGRKKGPT